MIVLKPDKTFIYILATEYDHQLNIRRYDSLREAQEAMISEFVDTCGGTSKWVDGWSMDYEKVVERVLDHELGIDNDYDEFRDIMDENNWNVQFYCFKNYAYIENCDGEKYVLEVNTIEV